MGYKLADGSDSSEYEAGDIFHHADWDKKFKLLQHEGRTGGSTFSMIGDPVEYHVYALNWCDLVHLPPNGKIVTQQRLELSITTEHDATKLDVVVVNGVRFVKE